MAVQRTVRRGTRTQTLAQVLSELDDTVRSGAATHLRPIPTGFGVLDDVLGGGLRDGELLLLGGPPGAGKTILALQWARHVARSGSTAIFACYEHEPVTLLLRLLALEIATAGVEEDTLDADISKLLTEGVAAGGRVEDLIARQPYGREALAEVRSYAERLVLVRASGSQTTIAELAWCVDEHRVTSGRCVLFVDYLQKIPLHPEPDREAEKVTRTVEGLKDLALDRHVPVVLVSAVDAEGMRTSRLRMHHLRGSSAIAFESDVVLMVNSKEKAVSKVHLAYDPTRARAFRDWIVMSVEKNRGGPNLIDLEFQKDFRHFRVDPEGGLVGEKLVDERSPEDDM